MATTLPYRVLTIAAAVTAAAAAGLSCGGEGESGTAPGPAPMAAIEIGPPTATIAPGGTVQLAAAPKDAAGNTLADRSVSWSTSDATVATASDAGLVTGVAEGEAVITATSESDPTINLSCTNKATFTPAQTGATFTGTADQTGHCTFGGERFENSNTFEVAAGRVQGTAMTFTEPGGVACVYQGTLVENPPIGGSGTVSCTGLLDPLFGRQVNETGTWEMTR